MQRIVTSGDVSFDWFRVPKPADETANLNWQLHKGSEMLIRPGGAFLLAEMVRAAVDKKIPVFSQAAPRPKTAPPNNAIRSYADLRLYPKSHDPKDKKAEVYRLCQMLGFQGPASGQPYCPKVAKDPEDASLVILDDAGNGFRDFEKEWPKALRSAKHKPLVIYKTCLPLAKGKLWEHLIRKHKKKLIVVVNVDDLRRDGVNISRRLSWDRTVIDFTYQVHRHKSLSALSQASHLIVRLGLDGAFLYSNQGRKNNLDLYFDPQNLEDGYTNLHPGTMLGGTNVFLAALAAMVQHPDLDGLKTGIRYGLNCSRRLLCLGFEQYNGKMQLPLKDIFTGSVDLADFSPVEVPSQFISTNRKTQIQSKPDDWSIIQKIGGPSLEDTASQIVLVGAEEALREVPQGIFGALRTIDKTEIESFQSIRNLMSEYIDNQEVKRPLSIAVFGPPGAGKSFGITEVADSLADKSIKPITFNVAQFTTVQDLTSALHQVRDVAIKGKVPLAFFDEFDSKFDENNLGWLKFFLSPMQDGEFKEGDHNHPIGKAIFVFAGGTAETFEYFSRKPKKGSDEEKTFKSAKRSDFVSRLRGHVNIMSLEQDKLSKGLYMVRRALILRSLLERKAKHLFGSNGNCHIHEGVLHAFLKVRAYKHGVRSMEAILDMSLLSGRKEYEPAALPAKQQLEMHVDADEFLGLMMQKIEWAYWLEILAEKIHEEHLKKQKGKKPATDPSMQSWGKLREDFKQSNREQADHIPVKLKFIGYELQPAAGKSAKLKLSVDQVELLAEIEHKRWNDERLRNGWCYGPVADRANKISPYLVPWDELPEGTKDNDRNAVKGIPNLLAIAGLAAVKKRSK